METADILHAAEGLLTQHWDRPVQLKPVVMHDATRSRVLRCRVSPAVADGPETVAVKHVLPRLGHPHFDTFALLNDWAACQFLGAIECDPPLAPLVYAGDARRSLIILEDLGEGEGANTPELLNGSDPDRATQGLLEHVALLARLHGATLFKASEYRTLRASLGPQAPCGELYTDPWSNARSIPWCEEALDSAISRYRLVAKQVGIDPEPSVDAEIAEVTQRVEVDPGPFLAFCKGDQHLGGDFIRCGRKLRLFDFGEGGFRHALLEGLPGRMTWGCYGYIPPRLLPQLDATYQAELALHRSSAADRTLFRSAMVDAGARWNLFHVIHRIPVALIEDRQQGPTTRRRLCVAWLEAFSQLAEEFSLRPALNRVARTMAHKLRASWSIDGRPQPPYGAFAKEY